LNLQSVQKFRIVSSDGLHHLDVRKEVRKAVCSEQHLQRGGIPCHIHGTHPLFVLLIGGIDLCFLLIQLCVFLVQFQGFLIQFLGEKIQFFFHDGDLLQVQLDLLVQRSLILGFFCNIILGSSQILGDLIDLRLKLLFFRLKIRQRAGMNRNPLRRISNSCSGNAHGGRHRSDLPKTHK